LPGIDYSVLKEFVSMPGVRLANVMPRVSIFALGVMPFLSMHVIAVLLCAVAPFFKNIVNEGAAGVKKINNFIYGGTILLSLVQSIFLSMWIENPTTFQGLVLVSNPGVIFRLITMLSLTAGVLVIILMGQMINKYGIGNGISLFLLSLILFRLRGFFPQMVREANISTPAISMIGLLIVIGFIGIIIFFLKSSRQMPIVVRGQESKSGALLLPLSITGILPISFANAVLRFPTTISMISSGGLFATIANALARGTWISNICWVALIVLFSYLYTAIVCNPLQLANRMKRFGLSIAGADTEMAVAVRIDSVMSKNVLIWTGFLCVAVFLPVFSSKLLGITLPLTGYNLIVLVGVSLGILHSLRNCNGLKEVFRHQDIKDVLVVKARLESEGINAVVDDRESFGRLMPYIVGPLAEKRILVSDSDYDRSSNLIAAQQVA